MAEWLNVTFSGIDGAVFAAMNNLAKSAGSFFTPFFVGVSLLGKGGIFFLVFGVILMLFKNTRKVGLSILIAVGVGALFTNVILKNAIARSRPYIENQEYFKMWEFVGANSESEYSFPSGHTTVTMTSLTAVFLWCNKKWSWCGFLFVLLMGISRMYLVVHYFTDVIGGIIVGGIAGTIAYFITKSLYNLLGKYKNKKFFNGFLEFDIVEFLGKVRKKD